MARLLMNEAERFLLEKWGEARLLEESMEDVRTKYKEVFERIINAVTEAHPELDAHRSYVTQFWGSGYIGFGRKSWPGGESNWPSGFWVNNLRLEKLATPESESPGAYIELSSKSKANLDFDAARVVLDSEAKTLLTREELSGTAVGESSKLLLWLPAPSKSKLLSSLSLDDGQKFVELFVSQFDMMARFVPVIDKVFVECLKPE